MKRLAVCMMAILCSVVPAWGQSQTRAVSDKERLIGAWHLVRIDAGDSQTQSASGPQPSGILIYTRDGHMSVQLMYPQSMRVPDSQYVRAGYEASFGSYEVDEARHTVTHHVQGSVTRNLLVGGNLTRVYRITQDGLLIIRSADPQEHWSVTWEHYSFRRLVQSRAAPPSHPLAPVAKLLATEECCRLFQKYAVIKTPGT